MGELRFLIQDMDFRLFPHDSSPQTASQSVQPFLQSSLTVMSKIQTSVTIATSMQRVHAMQLNDNNRDDCILTQVLLDANTNSCSYFLVFKRAIFWTSMIHTLHERRSWEKFYTRSFGDVYISQSSRLGWTQKSHPHHHQLHHSRLSSWSRDQWWRLFFTEVYRLVTRWDVKWRQNGAPELIEINISLRYLAFSSLP